MGDVTNRAVKDVIMKKGGHKVRGRGQAYTWLVGVSLYCRKGCKGVI